MERTKKKTRTKSKPTFESVWAAIDKLVAAQRQAEAERRKAEAERRKAEAERRKAEAEQRKAMEKERRKAEAEQRKAMEKERRKTEAERRKTEKERRKTEKHMRETDRLVRKLTESLKKADGNFNNKWGEFMENLVMGDFPGALRGWGIDARGVTPRMKYIVERTTKAEYDLVAHDGDTVVVAEVKTTLRRGDVEEFLEKLARFKERFSAYGGKRVLGAVAFLAVADERGKEEKKDGKKGRAADEKERKPADELAREAGLFVIRSPGGAPGLAVVENPPGFEPREF